MKSKRSKATDICQSVRDRVIERDNGQCIVCGNVVRTGLAHYISRAKGGLGIEENLVILCQDCHERYDHGTQELHKSYGDFIADYLSGLHPKFNDKGRVYNKYES